ncbi:hypothetical protein Tco_1297410, partial [Tanacetum coccineum]
MNNVGNRSASVPSKTLLNDSLNPIEPLEMHHLHSWIYHPNMTDLEDVSIFDFSRDDEDDGAEADMNNLDTTIQVSPIPTIRIHKDHPLEQVIRDLQLAIQTRKMSKNLKEHGFVSTIQQRTNHKD